MSRMDRSNGDERLSRSRLPSGSGSASRGSRSRAANKSSRIVRALTPSLAGCTGVIRPMCTRSRSSPRSGSTSWFASCRRPRYSWTTPETASSCPSRYMLAVHGWLKKVRSRYPVPSVIVTVTIDWRRRVRRLETFFTRAMTVAYASIFRVRIVCTLDRSM